MQITRKYQSKQFVMHKTALKFASLTNDFKHHISTKLPLSSLECGAILQSLTKSKSLIQGKSLHAHVISSGVLYKNTYLSTKLAAFYANCGHMKNAQIIFDQINVKNSFLWNYMIRGFSSNGFSLNALLLYRKMMSCGILPDNFTYPFVIKACGDSLLVEFGRIIHAEVVITGFESDVYVANCLLAMYFKFGEMDIARLMFDRMCQRDLTSWNTMITGYAKNGYLSEALSFFYSLQRSQLDPDCTTLLGLLSACSELQMVEKGKEIHAYVLRNSMFSSNRFLINSLVEVYCKCKTMMLAKKLFAVSSKDCVTWNTMISGYVQMGNAVEGLRLFSRMVAYGEQPDLATIVVLLGACEQVAAIDFGMSIHCYLVQKGFGSSTMAATALIGFYSKCGKLSCSQCLFDEISEKTLVSWTAMITAYGHHGRGWEAVSVFKQMVADGIVPDEGALTSILTACSHAGLVEDGREIFRQIQRYNMKAALAHYACVVDLLSRAGHLEDAYEVIKSMEVEPTVDIWVSLLSGCRLHGNVSLAEVSAQNVFKQNPNRVSGYISLSHTYADEKRWNDVEKLRGIAQSKGLVMPRGYSFVE